MKVFEIFRVSAALITALSLPVVGYADAQQEHTPPGKKIFTKHFQDTLFDITGNASYSVEVLLDDKEYKIGSNVVGVVIHDAGDEDVKGARLTIVHKNLKTGELAPGKSVVTDKGNGLYIVSGLDLQRDGRWELSISVRKGGIDGQVKFIFPDALRERPPKGRYSP